MCSERDHGRHVERLSTDTRQLVRSDRHQHAVHRVRVVVRVVVHPTFCQVERPRDEVEWFCHSCQQAVVCNRQQYMYRQLTKSLVSVQSRMITTRSCENLSPRLDTVSQSCHFTRCGGLFNKWSNNSDERLHRHLVTTHGSEWIRPTLMVRPISSCMVLWTHMNPTPNGISITSAKFC